MRIKTDALSYWFFRLNGFLTSVSFVIHMERRGETGTDIDLLGVRFPYRAELFEHPLTDFGEFTKITDRPYVAIAEVKKGRCDLNGPWTTRERRIVDRVLRAVGVFPKEHVKVVADSLYRDGFFQNEQFYVSLVCVGKAENHRIADKYPSVPQILWSDILSFIFRRFDEYQPLKTCHPQWDPDGQNLWDCFKKCRGDESQFIQTIEIIPE